jgi:hypothetical protein
MPEGFVDALGSWAWWVTLLGAGSFAVALGAGVGWGLSFPVAARLAGGMWP